MPKSESLLGGVRVVLAAGEVRATAGALDGNGCHYDRSDGKFHRHRDPVLNPDRNAPVRKSRQNLCHDSQSPNYRTLRDFVSCRTMSACVSSGGSEQRSPGGGLSGH